MRILRSLMIALVFMLGGLQVGTQWSASLLSPRERGPAWFTLAGYPLYRPYQGLEWYVLADGVAMEPFLLPLGVSFVGVFMGCLVLRFAVGVGRRRRPEQRISGARWATREDLRRGELL